MQSYTHVPAAIPAGLRRRGIGPTRGYHGALVTHALISNVEKNAKVCYWDWRIVATMSATDKSFSSRLMIGSLIFVANYPQALLELE